MTYNATGLLYRIPVFNVGAPIPNACHNFDKPELNAFSNFSIIQSWIKNPGKSAKVLYLNS